MRASQVAQWVKNPPAMQEPQETRVRSLGGEDPLEKEMATQPSILAWEIPWTEDPGEEGVPENLGVPLEGDRDFGELCGSHQGCQCPFDLQFLTWDFS